MPAQIITSTENNFTKGLITEFTGLNFPENAATDTDNCIYTLVGDVTRREGINYETNFSLHNVNRTSSAINTYKWNNVGGDGLTQVVVKQVGGSLFFYRSSSATLALPLSVNLLSSSVSLSNFTSTGGNFDSTIECQFSDGNGYLFVYHPNCDPFFCTYTAGTITSSLITVTIRDFAGIGEPTVPVNSRPASITNEHLYNLVNQGWVKGSPWQASSPTNVSVTVGAHNPTVASGLSVGVGDNVNFLNGHQANPNGVPQGGGTIVMSGTVSSYVGTTLTVNITSVNPIWAGVTYNDWLINPTSTGYINTWNAAIGNYPSNADVWWTFKNTSGVFDPATTIANVTLNIGQAAQGHFTVNAFMQQRSLISGVSSLTDLTTTIRPKTGTWFQGRVWYAGTDAQQAATGDAGYFTWTENIYFSQIVEHPDDFGSCFQTNDPTSETLFDLLPTDGGVIKIQGCGSIYKLFPLQNGMLVFAANGIWFITGSQGIGFAANDYTVTKISQVQSISGTSFVNVNGLPYFWNEEGIYSVQPSPNGGMTVEPLTVGTILSFYNNIPVQSKKFVRGDYHPIDYTIQWLYKDTNETSVTDRYAFNHILNFNTYNKAFFPYSLPNITGKPRIVGINYVAGPGGSNSPDPVFKYLTAASDGASSYNFTFSEEGDTTYTDFVSFDRVGFNFVSYFITGYKLHGQGQRRFQIPYIYMYSRTDVPTSYKIQGIWDYAISGNSGRISTAQLVNNWSPNNGMIARRHKIRGQGLVLQLKLSSVDTQPFDIIGWSTLEQQNMSV